MKLWVEKREKGFRKKKMDGYEKRSVVDHGCQGDLMFSSGSGPSLKLIEELVCSVITGGGPFFCTTEWI